MKTEYMGRLSKAAAKPNDCEKVANERRYGLRSAVFDQNLRPNCRLMPHKVALCRIVSLRATEVSLPDGKGGCGAWDSKRVANREGRSVSSAFARFRGRIFFE